MIGHDGCFFTSPGSEHDAEPVRPENVPLHELVAAAVMLAGSTDAAAYQEAVRDARVLLGQPGGVLSMHSFTGKESCTPLLPGGERVPLHFDLFTALYRLVPEMKDGLLHRLPAGDGARLRQEVLRMVQRHALYEVIRQRSTMDRDLSLVGATVLEEVASAYLEARSGELAQARSDVRNGPTGGVSLDEAPPDGTQTDRQERSLPPPAEDLTRRTSRQIMQTLKHLDRTAQAAAAAAAMGWDLSPATLLALYRDPHRLSEVARCVDHVHHHFGRACAALAKRTAQRIAASIPRAGLAFGSDLEMTLPEELALAAHPDPGLRALFYYRFASNSLLQYPHAPRAGDEDGTERGDVVILVDESASMGRPDAGAGQPVWYAKAFAAAIRITAKTEGRRVWIISFAARETDLLVLGDQSGDDAVLEWLGRSLGGGTDYGPALRRAFAILNTDSQVSEKADLVLLSDGRFTCPDDLIKQVLNARELHGLGLWGIRFGGSDFGALERLATALSVALLTPKGFTIDEFRPASSSESAGFDA